MQGELCHDIKEKIAQLFFFFLKITCFKYGNKEG